MLEKDGGIRQITRQEAVMLFTMELEAKPELSTEFERITGSLGLQEAVVDNISMVISHYPMIDFTPERLRKVVGAPGLDANEATLHEWKRSYWDAYKERKRQGQ
jgi:hypothetical protein